MVDHIPTPIRKARKLLSKGTEDEREAVKQELECIGASEITDILSWNSAGQVTMNPTEKLSHSARKSIKKIKVTPTRNGSAIEVEMHDKMAALRLLAKHHGLLDQTSDSNRPSVIGINLTGPEVTTYEVKESKE